MTGQCFTCGGPLCPALIGNCCADCYRKVVPEELWSKEFREYERKRKAS